MTTTYLSVSEPVPFCYEEKKSRFIAQVSPIRQKSDGFQLLAQAKLENPDARHYCWAYVLGDPHQTCSAGFNDDGEPSGTAGKPMLNVLMQRRVGDVFAIVTRYFGGVKLGAGGLSRAYGQAVSGALDQAVLYEIMPISLIRIVSDFSLEASIRGLLEQNQAQHINAQYDQQVNITCQVPTRYVDSLNAAIINRSAGTARVKLVEPGE